MKALNPKSRDGLRALEVCEDDSQLRWLYVRASLEELDRAWSPLGGDRGGDTRGHKGIHRDGGLMEKNMEATT